MERCSLLAVSRDMTIDRRSFKMNTRIAVGDAHESQLLQEILKV
jgi:hypothetical protein